MGEIEEYDEDEVDRKIRGWCELQRKMMRAWSPRYDFWTEILEELRRLDKWEK